MTHITPSHASAEVRRQARKEPLMMDELASLFRMAFWFLVIFTVVAGLAVLAFAAPFHDPIAAPVSCFSKGC